MSFYCFHIGQSFETARWSPSQFTHLGHFDSHLHCALPHHIQHKLLFLCTIFLCVQISGIGGIFGGWEYKVVFLFSSIQCWFFSGMSCPLIVIANMIKRTEIRLTAIIPCGSSSFFISSSSMLSSSAHLMTNFLEFNVGWGVTLAGIEPIIIVVLKRFLLWCFFSTSIKMLPDFIGLHCLGRPFAMPSTAFLSVNTFRFSGIFLSVASMMRNRGHWLSFWCVWLSSWLLSLDCVVGFEVEHGIDVSFCRFMLIMVWWGLVVFP